MKTALPKLLLAFGFILFTSMQSLAQDMGSSRGSAFSPRRQLATIIFGGLGGAVLGLSTLSFYPEPQDHLDNIGTGFAAGIIISTVFVTYSTLSYTHIEPYKYKLDAEEELYAAKDLKGSTSLVWQWQF